MSNTIPAPERPIWLRPEWTGPQVELRPDDADPAEWPPEAVERVYFRAEDHPKIADLLPAFMCYGADGWPLAAPNHLKPRFDVAMKEELHRYPVFHWDEGDWLLCKSHEHFMRLQYMLDSLMRPLLEVLPSEP